MDINRIQELINSASANAAQRLELVKQCQELFSENSSLQELVKTVDGTFRYKLFNFPGGITSHRIAKTLIKLLPKLESKNKTVVNREKQLAIQILKERIEHATGKKVIFEDFKKNPETGIIDEALFGLLPNNFQKAKELALQILKNPKIEQTMKPDFKTIWDQAKPLFLKWHDNAGKELTRTKEQAQEFQNDIKKIGELMKPLAEAFGKTKKPVMGGGTGH